jgi:hypoxanthine phosphoribosyltransferase
MKTINIKDKNFELFITKDELQINLDKLADKINLEMQDKNPIFICILTGAFIFSADLIRKITIPCQITFMRVSSYSGTESTKQIKKIIGLQENIYDRHVVILEDIVDSGLTLDFLITELIEKSPASIKIATMFFKPSAFQKNYVLDYIGMTIPDEFIIGYGLDYYEYGRNLPDIYKLKKN